MLIVRPPSGGWQSEKRYVARWLLEEILGIEANFDLPGSDSWELELEGSIIRFPNLFFPEKDPSRYLTRRFLDELHTTLIPSSRFDLGSDAWCEPNLPVFFSAAEPNSLTDVDWFGNIFFILTRFEEVVNQTRDEHERFPASASLLNKEKILLRPIVDEYIETFWRGFEKIFPGLIRKTWEYRFFLTHDVDVPTQWDGHGPALLLKRVAGDLLKRHSFSAAWTRARGYFDPTLDETNCFAWIMSESERRGLQSSFYFVAPGAHSLDPAYDVREAFYRDLIQNMRSRGHEIGIHGSYLAASDPGRLRSEVEVLERVAEMPIQGGRQHFLRFQVPETWKIWDSAGLLYDSSLGFADEVGFRCGTAHEFPVFDLKRGQELQLRERPLIVMEHTLLSPHYLGRSSEAALEEIQRLTRRVKKYRGRFTLLWHNHNLVTTEARQLYQAVLDTCVSA